MSHILGGYTIRVISITWLYYPIRMVRLLYWYIVVYIFTLYWILHVGVGHLWNVKELFLMHTTMINASNYSGAEADGVIAVTVVATNVSSLP